MKKSVTIGFPRMKKEPGEKRVFLPAFIQLLASQGASIYLEEGYGSRSGYMFEDYHCANPAVHQCSREEALQKDYVMLLRSPKMDEFSQLRPGSCLISMLHFPTRPKRIQILKQLGINAISLDSIVNDRGTRLVENMKAVAWNGLDAAFSILEKRGGLDKSNGAPMTALILGTGMVGKHAVDAAVKLGNIERNNDHIRSGGRGSIAIAVGRSASSNPEVMKPLYERADILVDAAQRRDCSCPVAPNEWIAWLPPHAIVTDLSVDPYTLDVQPPVVRGIEGIPQGNLDQYVYDPDDPKWELTVPASVPSQNRRTTVTCYSWPGIHPEASMTHYASQLEPLMAKLLEKGYDDLSMNGDYFERALCRAALKSW